MLDIIYHYKNILKLTYDKPPKEDLTFVIVLHAEMRMSLIKSSTLLPFLPEEILGTALDGFSFSKADFALGDTFLLGVIDFFPLEFILKIYFLNKLRKCKFKQTAHEQITTNYYLSFE